MRPCSDGRPADLTGARKTPARCRGIRGGGKEEERKARRLRPAADDAPAPVAVATRALPPPPLGRVERARRAGAAAWAWASDPRNRLAALVISALAGVSLGAIAAGLALGG